jgi:hypothetical protein
MAKTRQERVTEVMHPYTHNYLTAMQVASYIVRNWEALKRAMESEEVN